MYGFNPDNFPDSNSLPVCAECFSDEWLCQLIEDIDSPPGCSFCKSSDSPTAPLDKVCDHMRECLMEFFAFAADNLPFESRDGGYLGKHWGTYELLIDEVQLDLPMDQDGQLMHMLSNRISDQVWCEHDWLSLDYNVMLEHSWEKFCHMIQHERRFFFAIPKENTEEDENRFRNREEFNPPELLTEIVSLADELDLVQTLPAGTKFYRSRHCKPDVPYQTACLLGPPLAKEAFRANRMNPPGIPMMYGAESASTAVLESRASCVTVGQFVFEREVQILDLGNLTKIPSIFSGIGRRQLLGLIFMHAFTEDITRPVDRKDRSFHIDYIPSQVITEYIRDSQFHFGTVDGIRYPSELHVGGRNLVLFATQDDLMEPDGSPVSQRKYPPIAPWIRLVKTYLDKNSDRSQKLKTAVF